MESGEAGNPGLGQVEWHEMELEQNLTEVEEQKGTG